MFVCGLVSLQEGKPHKLPFFCGLRRGPREGELGVMQAEGLHLKNGGDPETCRGSSPEEPCTELYRGALYLPPELGLESPGRLSRSKLLPPLSPLKKLTHGPAHNTPKFPITRSPTQALPHRSGMTYTAAEMVCDPRAGGLS